MTRDREVNLGDLSDVSVDDHRKPAPKAAQAASKKPAPGKPAGTPPGKPSRPAAKPSGGASNGGWMAACLVLVVLIAVLGVWFHKQVAGLQAQLDNRLTESSQKLGNLESQLSATDETLNQSSGKLQDIVASHGKALEKNGGELRKLWDLANKRNRADIAEQGKKINALSASVTSVKKAQAGVDGKITDINKEAAALKKQVESAVLAVNKSSQQWQTQISQMQTQLDVLVENLNQVEKQQNSLDTAMNKISKTQASLSTLGERVDDAEAAVAAFDAYRLQVNNRLDKLESR